MNHRLALAALLLTHAGRAWCAADANETLVTADILCSPSSVFQYDAASKSCAAPTVDTLKEPDCKAVTGLAWDAKASSKNCSVKQAPAPSCTSSVLREALTFKDGQCFAQAPKVVSAPGNLMGDCIVPLSEPKGLGLTAGTEYVVTAQERKGDAETVTLLPVADDFVKNFSCWPQEGRNVPIKVPVASLQEAGYKRSGWVYGALMLPYKYHFHDKSFSNAVSIGPYFGRRKTVGVTAITFAASAGITQVDGIKVDAQGKAVLNGDGSPVGTKLAGFTFAAGLMFEVAKGASGGSPFKAGLFYGTDRVSRSDSAAFAHDRKPWVALQLGYDFTDN